MASSSKDETIPMNETSRDEREGEGDTAGSICTGLLVFLSILIIVITFPISIFFCIKVVQEYERAIIFRLGRIKKVG